MVNWSSPDIVKWKKEASEIQQYLFEKLGDRIWDYVKEDERWALKKKVGFALFGEPTVTPTETNNDNEFIGYKSKEMIEIYRICNLIYEQSSTADVYVAFLFVIGKINTSNYCIPVIKVRVGDEAVFLDSLGRRYNSWPDFQKNNKLPKSLVCYPLNGTYQSDNFNEVLLEFSTSPACALGSRICNTLDKVTTGVGLGASVIGAAGLVVTVAAPLAIASTVGMAATGVYGLFRGSQHLHDRGTHNQTISPSDSEARNCWLSVFGGAFGIGSALAVSRAASIAASGGVLGRTSGYIINFLNFGSLTVNGLGIVSGLACLVEKGQNKELTALDVFQWSASVFFFYNAAINLKTANGIVRDVQEGIKSDFASGLSKRRMKAYKRVMRETTADAGTMEGNAKLIKGISNIGSKDEFFRLVLKGQQKLDKGIKINQDGYLVARGELFLDTKSGVNYPINYKDGGNFFNLPGENFKCITKLSKETIKLMETISSEIRKNEIVIDENTKFVLKTELLTRLGHVFFRYCEPEQDVCKKKKEISNMYGQTEKLAQDRGCSTETCLVSFFEFICIYKKNKLRKMNEQYQHDKSELKSYYGDQVDEAIIDRKWGIQDSSSIDEAFMKQINEEITESNENLKKEFDKYNADVQILNESGDVKFRTDIEALIQFYRCFVIDLDEKLSIQEFFDTIRKTVEDESLRCLVKNKEDNAHILYYDKRVPVVVEVQKTDCGTFFETISFQDFDVPEELMQS